MCEEIFVRFDSLSFHTVSRLKLTKGSRVLVFPLGKGVMVVPADPTIDGLTQRIQDALAAKGISARRALKGLEKTRRRVFQQLYGAG